MSKPIQNSSLVFTKHDANSINSHRAAATLIVSADLGELLRILNPFKRIGKIIPYYDVEHRCKGELKKLKA